MSAERLIGWIYIVVWVVLILFMIVGIPVLSRIENSPERRWTVTAYQSNGGTVQWTGVRNLSTGARYVTFDTADGKQVRVVGTYSVVRTK